MSARRAVRPRRVWWLVLPPWPDNSPEAFSLLRDAVRSAGPHERVIRVVESPPRKKVRRG